MLIKPSEENIVLTPRRLSWPLTCWIRLVIFPTHNKLVANYPDIGFAELNHQDKLFSPVFISRGENKSFSAKQTACKISKPTQQEAIIIRLN